MRQKRHETASLGARSIELNLTMIWRMKKMRKKGLKTKILRWEGLAVMSILFIYVALCSCFIRQSKRL